MQSPPRAGDAALLDRLRELLSRVEREGPGALSESELLELPRLYRFAVSQLARLEAAAGGRAASTVLSLRGLVGRAHAALHRGIQGAGIQGGGIQGSGGVETLEQPIASLLERGLAFFAHEVPRTIRGEWRVIAASFGLIYGLALISFLAVWNDLDLAWSLMSQEMVSQEISQLEATAEGEPFRGNFTFGLGQSPQTAGWIMTHNMSVGILFFGAGLLPPVFLVFLALNGLMLGTYTAVAAHWGQGLAISSILWCHGTIEIQAIVLAGASGLVLVRAWIAPGPWSRRHAMALESRRALRLLAPVFPMLFVAGTIEGFVSPHAPTGVRVAVAALSGIGIVAWVVFGGRYSRRRVSSQAASRGAAASAGSASSTRAPAPRSRLNP